MITKTDPTYVPDLSGLNKVMFRDAVLMERKWELHLEGVILGTTLNVRARLTEL